MALRAGLLLRRGLRRRCPVCGAGGIFRRWVVMAERCPSCTLRFRRVPGQWLGSWFLNVCVAQAVLVGGLVAGAAVSFPEPPGWAWVVGILVASVAVPVVAFPWSRTVWLALDLVMRPLELHEDVPPGWELHPAPAAGAGDAQGAGR